MILYLSEAYTSIYTNMYDKFPIKKKYKEIDATILDGFATPTSINGLIQMKYV